MTPKKGSRRTASLTTPDDDDADCDDYDDVYDDGTFTGSSTSDTSSMSGASGVSSVCSTPTLASLTSLAASPSASPSPSLSPAPSPEPEPIPNSLAEEMARCRATLTHLARLARSSSAMAAQAEDIAVRRALEAASSLAYPIAAANQAAAVAAEVRGEAAEVAAEMYAVRSVLRQLEGHRRRDIAQRQSRRSEEGEEATTPRGKLLPLQFVSSSTHKDDEVKEEEKEKEEEEEDEDLVVPAVSVAVAEKEAEKVAAVEKMGVASSAMVAEAGEQGKTAAAVRTALGRVRRGGAAWGGQPRARFGATFV